MTNTEFILVTTYDHHDINHYCLTETDLDFVQKGKNKNLYIKLCKSKKLAENRINELILTRAGWLDLLSEAFNVEFDTRRKYIITRLVDWHIKKEFV